MTAASGHAALQRLDARRWVGSVAAAEALGIGTAAALTSRPTTPGAVLATAAVVGAVEGTALGLAQGWQLRSIVPGLRPARWVAVTAAVAVLAWLLSSIPQAATAGQAGAAGGDRTGDLPWGLALLVGVPLGAVFGTLLGAGQAVLLRGRVPHPWRWTSATAIGWTLGFPVIMAAASAVPAGAGTAAVLAAGAAAGAVAGLLLGAATYLATGGITVAGPRARRWPDRLALEILRGPAHELFSGHLVELRYRGRRTGAEHALPVRYAVRADRVGHLELIVQIGRPSEKQWYRSIGERTAVTVILHGMPMTARATLVRRRDAGFTDAWAAYHRRYPRARLGPFDPLVRIETVHAARGAAPEIRSRPRPEPGDADRPARVQFAR
jgi:hypothetical protein